METRKYVVTAGSGQKAAFAVVRDAGTPPLTDDEVAAIREWMAVNRIAHWSGLVEAGPNGVVLRPCA